MSDIHFPIINYIGKMESRPTIFFDNDKVIKLDKIDRPIIFVDEKWWSLKNISPDPNCIRFPFKNALLHFLQGQFWAFTVIGYSHDIIIFALLIILLVILGWFMFTLLFDLTVRLCFSLMRAKAGICEIIFQQHLLNVFVQCKALTLYVWLVFRVGVVHWLIRVDIEPLESIKYVLKRALNIAVLFLFNIDLLGRYLRYAQWTFLDFSLRIIDWRGQFLNRQYASFLLGTVRTWP